MTRRESNADCPVAPDEPPQALEPASPAVKFSWRHLLTALALAGLLVPSAWVFLRGASDEPYTTFRTSDAVVQVGVASALMALWVVLTGFIVAQVAGKKLPRAWLSVFLLGALAIGGLSQSPAGYISDLVHFGVVVR